MRYVYGFIIAVLLIFFMAKTGMAANTVETTTIPDAFALSEGAIFNRLFKLLNPDSSKKN